MASHALLAFGLGVTAHPQPRNDADHRRDEAMRTLVDTSGEHRQTLVDAYRRGQFMAAIDGTESTVEGDWGSCP